MWTVVGFISLEFRESNGLQCGIGLSCSLLRESAGSQCAWHTGLHYGRITAQGLEYSVAVLLKID